MSTKPTHNPLQRLARVQVGELTREKGSLERTVQQLCAELHSVRQTVEALTKGGPSVGVDTETDRVAVTDEQDPRLKAYDIMLRATKLSLLSAFVTWRAP